MFVHTRNLTHEYTVKLSVMAAQSPGLPHEAAVGGLYSTTAGLL